MCLDIKLKSVNNNLGDSDGDKKESLDYSKYYYRYEGLYKIELSNELEELRKEGKLESYLQTNLDTRIDCLLLYDSIEDFFKLFAFYSGGKDGVYLKVYKITENSISIKGNLIKGNVIEYNLIEDNLIEDNLIEDNNIIYHPLHLYYDNNFNFNGIQIRLNVREYINKK